MPAAAFPAAAAGAPVVTDERHAVAIETCRGRLVAGGGRVRARVSGRGAALADDAAAVRAARPKCMPAGFGRRPARRRRRAPISSTATAARWRRRSTRRRSMPTPRQILDAREATRAILSVLPQTERGRRLRQADLRQELCLDQAAPDADAAVCRSTASAFPGLQFSTRSAASIRTAIWPRMSSAICGIDNNGLAGIERALDETVKSSAGPLQLSLDARVQFILHEELAKVISDFSAKGAAGIVMDVNTGEIIAMVSLPDFDPNHPGVVDPKLPQADAKDRIFNRNTLGVYEMGSVFKIFNTAMALDAGVATMTKSYDASHSIQIGRFTIDDYHGKHRWLSVPEIFMYSSNIGSARMAVDAGATAAARFPRPARPAEAGADRVRRGRQAALSPAELARSQRHDDRLWPRHLGDPAACRSPRYRRSSMAASCIRRRCARCRPARPRPASA